MKANFSHMSCMIISLHLASKRADANVAATALHASVLAGIARAERQRVQRAQVLDRAIGGHRGTDRCEAAEDAARSEGGIERVEMGKPVEQRQDERFRSDGGRDGGDGRIEIVGFAAKDHEIDEGLRSRHRFDGQARAAERTLDDEARLFQALGPRRTHEECYVGTSLSETAAEIAADAARTQNQEYASYSP